MQHDFRHTTCHKGIDRWMINRAIRQYAHQSGHALVDADPVINGRDMATCLVSNCRDV